MGFRRRWPGVSYGRGEDWHYVGAAGEPAWTQVAGVDSWTNNQGNYNLGFRKREAGIVDIQGIIRAVADPPSGAYVFTLPVGYRPSAAAINVAAGLTTASKGVVVEVIVRDDGKVAIFEAATDPYPAPGNADALMRVTLNLQVFLNPADAP